MERIDSPFIDSEQIKGHHKKTKRIKRSSILLIALSLFAVVVLLFCYLFFLCPVRSVSVKGNHFLSEDYIRSIVPIDENSRYHFLFRGSLERKAEADPLIDDIIIHKEAGRCVVIDVKENTIVGYQVSGDALNNEAVLILKDGQIIEFKAEYLNNIALSPLFVNVSPENCSAIAKELGKLDLDIISRISELTCVKFTYDENMVKLTMEDGYQVYSPITGLGYMKNYFDIIVNDNQKSGSCIMILEEYSRAVIMECDEVRNYYSNSASE